jgi:hypothetical protein
MTWVAVAIGGAAVVGAVGSNLAAGKQASADQNAAQTQMNMFNTIVGQEKPYMTAGNTAESQLTAQMGKLNAPFTAADYLANQDPGYQFQLQTGAQATRNADTPGVGSLSGPALKDLMGFNQNMAATGYQNAFNRYQTTNTNTYNRLMGVSQLGQNAASNTGAAGASLGTGTAQAIAAGGAATAGGIVGSTNAASGALSSGAGYSYLSSLNAGNTSGSQINFDTSGGATNQPIVGYCDYRLKEAIEPAFYNPAAGLMVYSFNWKEDEEGAAKTKGYIAQEVQKKFPEAVSTGAKGYLQVDYSKIPIPADAWDELKELGHG